MKHETLNHKMIFLGPKKYNNNYDNYIFIEEWDNKPIKITGLGLLDFGNIKFTINKLYDYIIKF